MICLNEDGSDARSYRPTAVYFTDADCLEYVRRDGPCVYRRIDNHLSLVLDMYSREAIGFKFKGFKRIYKKHLQTSQSSSECDFVDAVEIFESFFRDLGEAVFEVESRRIGYEAAVDIAESDKVQLRDLPAVA